MATSLATGHSQPSHREQLDASVTSLKRFRSFKLVVRQQPERARLCSFKEENETSGSNRSRHESSSVVLTRSVDRRPVDPPPVVEVQSLDHDIQ